MAYKIFTVNPGSTSTKIALFSDDECLFSKTVHHDAKTLSQFKELSNQFEYRRQTIIDELEKSDISLEGTDAFSGRAGGLVGLSGGVYNINGTLYNHAKVGFTVKHPASLGPQLAKAFADEYGGRAFVVNPPDVDEFIDKARITGWKGIYRESRIHTLNQKEIGIRYGAEHGKKYEDMNLIICHIGGGVSVTAHQKGRMIDSNDIAQGDGPMAPTRSGSIPVKDVVELCFSQGMTKDEMKDKITKSGGFIDHLATSDGREVCAMIENGHMYAKLVYDAFIYQIGKYVGSMACAMNGEVDGIIITGGIARDKYLTDELDIMLKWIAPVSVMAGEFEMEALASGALRVLKGEESAKEYSGIPVWRGFDTEK